MAGLRHTVISFIIAVICSWCHVTIAGECDGVVGTEPCRDFIGDDFCFHTGRPLYQQCVDNICQCTGADYSKCTCLPNVSGCEIEADASNAQATYSFRGGQSSGGYKVYSCVGENPNVDLHVISNYEGSREHHFTSDIHVDIKGRGNGNRIVLVFTSYEPVNWILNFTKPNVIVDKVLLISHYLEDSRVTYQAGRVLKVERGTGLPRGYGDDSGGGNTVGLLKYLEEKFGRVTSFTGTYQADHWVLTLQEGQEGSSSPVSCDFEDSTICGYIQDKSAEFNWTRRIGSSGWFGPSHANMYKEGYYMSAQAGSIPQPSTARFPKARLVSPSYTTLTQKQCLKFYHQCVTSGIGDYQSRLNVYVQKNNRRGRPVWADPICNERSWHLTEIELDNQIGSRYQIVFETVHSRWPFTNMAVDDVTLTEGPCQDETTTAIAPTTTTESSQDLLTCYCNQCNGENTCQTDGSCFGEKFVVGGKESYTLRCLDQAILETNPQLCLFIPASGRLGFQTLSICCNDKDHCNLAIVNQPHPATTIPPKPTLSPFADKPGVCPPPSEMGTCSWECNHDPECPGEEKCCQTLCGPKCLAPYVEPTPEPDQEQCWSGRQCAQCDRRFVGRINGRRVCCPQCRQTGFRIDGDDCTCSKPVEVEIIQQDEEEGELSRDEWTAITFEYDDSYTSCHGDQYVKLSGYQVGKYVGVVLCSPTRYKIFLSDDLDGTFLNIGDSSGHGQDHCEFIGGIRPATNIDNNFWNSPSNRGYYRSNWNDTPQIGNIGGGTGSNWTGKFYGRWIECGISIP